jgi:glycosyltransferase involved in cell wall biosynthesis
MKKLLIITRWYLPAVKSGGTVRSITALVNGLKDEFSINILTSDRDLGATEPYENIEFNTLTKHNGTPIIYLSQLNIKNIKKYIELINPDIIYINSFFDITTQVIMFLKLRGEIKAEIILAPRGELAKGALSIKANKKRVYLFLYKLFNLSKGITFHATSPEDALDIKNNFPNNKVEIIQNPKEENRVNYTLPIKEKNSLKMVFISRIAPVKNLLYALKILEKIEINGFLTFDIYGPDEDKNYWNACQEVIAKLPSNIEINYKGFVHPSEISATLSKYHLFFLPTKGENFGHAIVEAMQVGLIPLISNKTPWQNLETINSGFSLSLENNTSSFTHAIIKVLEMENESFIACSTNVKSYITQKINIKKNIESYIKFFGK